MVSTPNSTNFMSSITAHGRFKQRAAIVTLRFCCDLSYPEISSQLSINDKTMREPRLLPSSCRLYNKRAHYQQKDVLRFYDLKPIDAVSQALRKHEITLSPPTIENIMLNHRGERHPYAIVRGSQLQKPALNEEALSKRRNYCNWLIREDSLHSPHFFLYAMMRRLNLLEALGPVTNHVFLALEPPKFTFMICAATSTDTNCKMDRPCIIWEADTPEQSQDLRMRVTTANQRSKERIKNKQLQATIPDTAEERALREINSNIQRENVAAVARNRETGKKGPSLRKGTRHQLKPEQFFKQEEFLYKEVKGISGLWYAESILKKHLFPYYNSVREHNPGKRVYLVQDNVHLHSLGMRYCAPEIEAQQILVAPHPTNSPDLHLIELCFGELGRRLNGLKVQSSGKEAKEMATRYIQEIWQHDEEMRQFMADHLHPTAWRIIRAQSRIQFKPKSLQNAYYLTTLSLFDDVDFSFDDGSPTYHMSN
ncbi:uncharacterized protein BDR25DRAFT_362211 [Lindgomyces ingoldianus]|uniref:Uncharacterized protein n=1 Tax=Lindgomyces ingoldianus TaxID=673940 RepID=A0ACB6QBP8_9PLEO|nr:uncharacterized protein BDR25DRAFT_362211 [Lindgomyces ingoldianus]KAF2463930.1 hypothetical protein BDR25DRAFT_362211 [Lindgomyces ingoldianus]